MGTVLAFDDALRFGAHCAMKGGAFLAVACVLYFAMRRASAARRHMVLASAVCGVLAMPLLAALLPRVDLAILPRPAATSPAAAPIGAPEPAHFVMPAPQRATARSQPRPAERGTPPGSLSTVVPARGASRIDGAFLLVAVWALGACAVFLPTVIGLVGIRGRTRRARPFADPSWASLLNEGARQLGVRRPVRLLQSDADEIPITWGTLRPVILLPAHAEAWSDERKRVVVQHELGHIKRWDFATQLVGRLVCAVHWFNPLAWFVDGALRTESEGACDDLVLNAGSRPPEYAEHLLDIVRTLRPASSVAFVGIAMARIRRIERRVRAIIDATRSRGSVTRRAIALTLVVALAVAWGAAVLHPTARAQSEKPVSLDRDMREKNLKLMGLVFKMYANESREESFPAKSVEHGAFYPEVPEIWPEYLTAPEVLAFIKGETDVQVCYLGHVVRNEQEALALLDAYEQQGPEAVRNRDVTIGEGADAVTLYRLREGVERFLITDINVPAAAARAQSEIPIMWELADTSKKKGGYCLYMDGHVAWKPYPGEFPMTEALTKRTRAMMNAAPGEITREGGKLAVEFGEGRLGQDRRGGGGGGGGRGSRRYGGRGGLRALGGVGLGGAGETLQAPAGTDSGGASLSEYLTPDQHRRKAEQERQMAEQMAVARADVDLEQRVLDAAFQVLMLRDSLKRAEERARSIPGGVAADPNTEPVARLTQALRRGEAAVHEMAQQAARYAPRLRIAPSGSGARPSAYLTLERPGAAAGWTRVDIGDEFEGLRVDEIVADEQAVRLTDLESGKQLSLTTNDWERARSGVGGGAPEDWGARRAEELEREAFELAKRSLAEEREAAARQRAEAGPPQIKVKGFFEDAETGVVTAFLEVEGPTQGRTTKVAVQEGDSFQGVRLDEILKDQKGVRVTDLATGQESTVVPR